MFAAIFWFCVKMAIVYGISAAIRGKTHLAGKEAAGLDSYKLPTAEEGRPIPVIFGKRRVLGPNVVWYGDFSIRSIQRRVKTSMFNTKSQTIGHRYWIGMHLIAGYANADGVKQIWVGEKLAWPDTTDPSVEAEDGVTSAYVNAGAIFGGSGKEGGIDGYVDFMYGESSQSKNVYLVSRLGSDISAYRGLLSVVLKYVYVGTNAYIKPWSFLIKRTDKLTNGDPQWYSSKAKIGDDDLNPIHIIRECLTNYEFGLGTSVIDINDTNFRVAADILYTEGIGLSYNWDLSTPIEDFIGDVLNIINGFLYQNMSTGKWEITLTREPTPNELANAKTFNEEAILGVEEFNRPAYGEITNQITVNWNDRRYNKNRHCTVHDSTLIEKQNNAIIEKSFNYNGICDKTVANKIANRELMLATSMLATMKITCNRQMAYLKPGDIFKLSWSNLGITTMIVRVLEADYGDLSKNEIVFHCVEDVFSTEYTIYTNPADTLWTDSISDPVDTTYRKLIETPYWILCWDMGKDIVDDLDNDLTVMLCCAVKPTQDTYEFRLLVRYDSSSDFITEGPGPFTPSATLKDNLVRAVDDIEIELENIVDLNFVEDNTYAVIEDEIVIVLSIDAPNNKIIIARGIFDSKPSVHSSGSRIWFIESNIIAIHNDYTNGDTPGVKFLTRTGKGELLEEDATTETADAFNSRMIRPYLPGNLKINNESFPEYLYGQPTLTWNHRDRTHQDQLRNLIRHTDAADYGPETGVTYTIQFCTEAGVVEREITGLTGKTYTYSAEDEETDFGKIQHKLRIKLWAIRDTYDSWQIYDIILERPLYGSSAGQSTVSGTIKSIQKIAGSSAGQSTVSGTLTVT